MVPNPNELLDIAGITTPLIGFYDVPELLPFEPFSIPKRCFFSSYTNWLEGYSTSDHIVLTQFSNIDKFSLSHFDG